MLGVAMMIILISTIIIITFDLHHNNPFPQLHTVVQNETKTAPIDFNETFNLSAAMSAIVWAIGGAKDQQEIPKVRNLMGALLIPILLVLGCSEQFSKSL